MKYKIHSLNRPQLFIEKSILENVELCLKTCDVNIHKGNASKIRESLHKGLQISGWSKETHIDPKSKITITSIYKNVALCIQTGNMGRMYADLLKLQTLFNNNRVDSAIFIIPSKISAKILGDNIANFERLINELIIFNKVICIPLVIYGFHDEEK